MRNQLVIFAVWKRKNIEETILIYISAWNETEREAIKERISRCRAPEATFIDRLTDTSLKR